MSELDIMFSDLTLEAQQEVLEFLGINKPEEANFDTFPLFVLENDLDVRGCE